MLDLGCGITAYDEADARRTFERTVVPEFGPRTIVEIIEDIDVTTQLPQFRDVANFNVGLLGQQAGISLGTILWAASKYAAFRSSNYKSDQPHGLDPRTRELIE